MLWYLILRNYNVYSLNREIVSQSLCGATHAWRPTFSCILCACKLKDNILRQHDQFADIAIAGIRSNIATWTCSFVSTSARRERCRLWRRLACAQLFRRRCFAAARVSWRGRRGCSCDRRQCQRVPAALWQVLASGDVITAWSSTYSTQLLELLARHL